MYIHHSTIRSGEACSDSKATAVLAQPPSLPRLNQCGVIAIYAPDEAVRENITRTLPVHYDRLIIEHRTPLPALECIAHVTEGIIWSPKETNASSEAVTDTSYAYQLKSYLKSRRHFYYVINITSNGELERSELENTLPLTDMARFLAPTVVRARMVKRLSQMVIAIGAATHLPKKLRIALAQAVEPTSVFTSVEQLAETVGCDRRTLWHHWSQIRLQSSTGSLLEFLNSILLTKAIIRKTPEHTWSDVGRALGVHQSRLLRHAQQWLESTLDEIPDPPEEFIWSHLKPMVTDIIGFRMTTPSPV